MNDVRLHIPAAAEYLDIVRLSLYGIASKLGFSYEDIEDMKVAVSEACNNAVLHGETSATLGQIQISYELGDGKLTVKVKDDGPGFDYEAQIGHSQPPVGDSLSELQSGGLGMYLMQALMDEVTVNTDQGTEITLVKYVTNERDGL
ncbi:anti-sigma B factor RsbW [Paenibacillus aceris]|uniref:Serine/threonine-protein kinase RsbW n=1 Tax=Paenibacillus aceris TaxID=869555 RepID=A0ABS4I1E3_9BACL|nr:anti-sigma B factor RsbW [Paenibacillus aceris]MBP1964744.1 serine/threonine-protein kinase RsbW [Paenibacillus aceris]NHW33730.1 anti-sigma B factor RsbW [Paenibacillus aceris]